MVVRTLITTAKENTWPKDKNRPVLFLGEWCKLYKRKNLWEGMDSKTIKYHWDDRNKLKNDYISIVPIQFDLTDHSYVNDLKLWSFE